MTELRSFSFYFRLKSVIAEYEVSMQSYKEQKVKLGETVMEKSQEIEKLISDLESFKQSFQVRYLPVLGY